MVTISEAGRASVPEYLLEVGAEVTERTRPSPRPSSGTVAPSAMRPETSC